jgi:hypothetical protein
MTSLLAVEPLLGQRESLSPRDMVAAAALLFYRGRVAEAAELYDRAFREDASLTASGSGHLYLAMRAAARADAAWRARALPWARSFYEWRRREQGYADTIRDVSMWLAEPDFASIRDADDLPEEWRRFWADMRALRAEASVPE